ncbi:uncharacterized protein C19orf47 homolog [Acanthaster planci]|uniref:Uncharacterized protein C19orf47 homolog n=1 Tax=Acanthaster planci TaxID=133434 RepID=A0A8B7Y370_ACAPL|nr:uncharacterized protein C19orf47 homolog [Acanthaster planci]
MATKSTKEMSEWIKFFTAAGIPPGPAAKYAMAFIDNRIDKSMLMDLTKDYLKDMGVSIMGDVISILKHAKSAYSQYERERPILEAMPQPEDGKIELKRQTTPGSRMLEHYMRKEGIMEDSNTKVKVTTAMATRLGAVPSAGSKKKPVGVPDSVEVIPVKKARRVPPEEEGAYVISLPKGSTERTKKILDQKAQDTKSSVFARLGAGLSDVGVAQTSIGGQMTTKSTAEGKQGGTPTIFNRLGGQSHLSSPTNPVLQYHGVLKSSPKSSPTPKIKTGSTIPKAKVTVVKGVATTAAAGSVQERLGVQRPEVSTTTLTHMDSVGLKHSLLARLGGQKGDLLSPTQPKVMVRISKGNSLGGGKQTSPAVLARLGAQKPNTAPTAATKPKQTVITLKPGLTKRLGGQKAPAIKAGGVKAGGAKSGVMARLGKKQKQTSPVRASSAQAPNKVQKRLGLPLKGAESAKASLKERLGLQKAEASSTTPTFTVTLGGAGASSKPARKKKRKSVARSQAETTARSVTMGQDVFSRLGSG